MWYVLRIFESEGDEANFASDYRAQREKKWKPEVKSRKFEAANSKTDPPLELGLGLK
jgi:hypothetical protein